MSNQAVGNVYQTIIDEVISSSRVDFEESGVDDSVLEELRKGWQRKLSQLDVARFPWDPKPEPPTPAQNTHSAPAPAPTPASQNHGQLQFSPELPLPNAGVNDTAAQSSVKSEPGIAMPENVKQKFDSQYSNYNGTDNKNSIAASRAAQQLQLQYGMRAAGSINAIQQKTQQQPGQSAHQQNPGSQGADSAAPHQEAQGTDTVKQLNSGQVDGSGDVGTVEGILLGRDGSGSLHELDRSEIDAMLHKQIVAKAKAMEGGGLMLPLREATKIRTGRTTQHVKDKGRAVAVFDGGDDDEPPVDDEDAINSDLDDPDDDRDDDEVDDEGLGHIMLCMYDKVQRVKNKWKCTLKDGVLTVNGKEYVFHKATGEYEW